MKQTVEEAAEEAIHKHYNCDGEHPCGECNYCMHFKGSNTSYDCCECGADEFNEGFIVGAEWQAKQLGWISVVERLPTDDSDYIVLLSNGIIGVGIYDNEAEIWRINGIGIVDNVFLYMPIPSFDEILEANKDVLQRMKRKGEENENN